MAVEQLLQADSQRTKIRSRSCSKLNTVRRTQTVNPSPRCQHLHRCPRTAVGKAKPRVEGAGRCRHIFYPGEGTMSSTSAAAFGGVQKNRSARIEFWLHQSTTQLIWSSQSRVAPDFQSRSTTKEDDGPRKGRNGAGDRRICPGSGRRLFDRNAAVMTAACACLHIAISVFHAADTEAAALALLKDHFAKVRTTMG